MHKIIMWFFNNLNNIGQTLSLICSFYIMTTVIYWLESIFKAQWNWLNFIKPSMDALLNFANNIFPFSFALGGNNLDGKFIVAMVLLMCLMVVLRFLLEGINNFRDSYENMHITHKKAIEKEFNRNLKNNVIVHEQQISEYMILIHTRLQKKFINSKDKFNVPDLNNSMNDILYKKTNIHFEDFEGGFLYRFSDFNKIDNILDILFKIKKSSSPLDYAICVQAGDNIAQLKKLAHLQGFGKIIFCADTLLRYKCNKSHAFGTESVGIFHGNDSSIEVHEFREIL